ncbi:hypothetical protein YH66_15140 [[Brevibacterium] flavum]|uniref:Uncharacterized protein n=1 Tax=[Brevibacterium] flavum TaxID=92706 RepID=A0A0F6SRY4_9CORY|nr:hypothetical protein YH66_15140 [[Brevibacterium] flavum]
MALPDDGAFELSEGAENAQHQLGPRSIGFRREDQVFLDEVHARTLGGDLVNDLLQVDLRPSQ